MEMRDQPGGAYTANHLDSAQHGPLVRHGALCLEAGRVPNGPNMATIAGPDGPIPVVVTLRPGHTYRWLTSWQLG
jgi:aldose 1-epimerase